MDKIIEKWDEILNTVKQEYEISDVSFDTWIRALEIFGFKLYFQEVPCTTSRCDRGNYRN